MSRHSARIGRSFPRQPLGVLVAAGQESIGASVAAALLAREAQEAGARVLLVGPELRAQRLAALFGVTLQSPRTGAVQLDRAIHVSESLTREVETDVVIWAPAPRPHALLEAIDALAAQTDPLQAVVLAPAEPGALAAAYAALKLILGRQPRCAATVTPCGETDVSALIDAARQWLDATLRTSPALPFDPTLPVALGAGIPLAEAVADTALLSAAGALWSALVPSAPLGAIA